MPPRMVGLIGSPHLRVLQRLEREIVERGLPAVCVDLAGFPEELTLSIGCDGTHAQQNGQGTLTEDVGAIYIARGEYMSPLTSWLPTEDEWAPLANTLDSAVRRHQESRSVRASVYRLFSDTVPMVNCARAHRACLLAPALLRRLAMDGVPVSDFVSGNDLEQIAYFVHSHAGTCRARRFGQPSSRDWPLDLDYLRDHHLDFDEFPLIVRRASAGAGAGSEVHVLTVGEHYTGAATWDHVANRWQHAPDPWTDAQRLAIRAAQLAGLHVALVHIEQGNEPKLIGIDPEPDLALLEDQAGVHAIPALADLLAALSLEAESRRPPAQAVPPRTRDAVARPTRSPRPTLRIGITGLASNAEVAALAAAVEARGATPVLLELPWFPTDRALHECADGGRIATDQLADLDAVFLRSTGVTSPVEATVGAHTVPWPDRRLSFHKLAQDQAECFLFQYSVLEALGHRIPVINPPLAQEVHRTKVHQLFSLMRAGFPVPATLAGNDKDACARFVAAQGGERMIVVKPLAGIYKTTLLSDWGLDTSLRSGPVILQRCIRGDTIRAYFVGGRLIGAAKSLCSGDAIDSSVGQYGVQVVDLPESVAALGWAAARHLGLSWTGMDFIRDASTGEYFILECNAAAMFANFSAMTGFDVAGALADYLIAVASHGTR